MLSEKQESGLFGHLKNWFGAERKHELSPVLSEYAEEYVRPSVVGLDAPMSSPMSTRTVFFETKSAVKERVHVPEISHDALDITFAEQFIDKGGKFVYCETLAQVIDEIKNAFQRAELGARLLLGKRSERYVLQLRLPTRSNRLYVRKKQCYRLLV